MESSECAEYFNHEVVGEFEPKMAIKITMTVLYALILLTGIIGNSITIKVTQVLLKNGYLQKNVTDHMVSLACSDLLVLLLGMPVELYSVIWYPFTSASGNASCKIYNFLFEACSYATILNVATLSFERYIAICHPFKYKSFSGSRTVKLICFVWLTSVCVALPLLFTMGIEDPLEPFKKPSDLPAEKDLVTENPCIKKSNFTICTNLSSMWPVYQSSIFSAFIIYIVVLVSVTFMCREMTKILKGNRNEPVNTKNGEIDMGFLPKHDSPQVKASRKQTIIFLGLIVGTLAGCWMPNQIRRIMSAARPKTEWTRAYFRGYITLLPIADTFFYLSSVVNPFLYNLSSRQFREVFMQVLRCRLTIEHINKRTLRRHKNTTVHSARPLMLASFRRSLSSHKKPKESTFITFQSSTTETSTASLNPSSPVESPELVKSEQTAEMTLQTTPKKNSLNESSV
ncbi:G-protein coupled receptor 39-like [Acipenser ruthenus]|uniref:G-protein coupled receptor 39-like n=1 Tax=Acipenser ruthenus TaxID=7906 RepID=UPI00145B5955|nr:G-protein coupled receptor 39-like [Acipenser ruthenus]